MSERKTIFQYAKEFTGDPDSFDARGALIFKFLHELGLKKTMKVLNIGCGCLSEGFPLIFHLNRGKFVGLDPNGWLIEAALQEKPHVLEQEPRFYYGSDFTVPEADFDVVVSHSVLSHVADWQLDLALTNVRKLVSDDAFWLASYRRGQENSYRRTWAYPGISEFREETLRVRAYACGWHMRALPELRDRMVSKCPNDFHDWILLTAIPTPAEIHLMQVTDEQIEARGRGILEEAEHLWRDERAAADAELEAEIEAQEEEE